MINRLRQVLLSILVLAALNGCNGNRVSTLATSKANIQILEGEVYYRERILLPPGALLEMTLEDVSKMDVASVQISSVQQTLEGGTSPYPFSLNYDAALIKPNMRYNLRAKVMLSDKLLMTSTEQLDPFRNSHDRINIKLSTVAHKTLQSSAGKSVDKAKDSLTATPLSTLTNTYWKLMTLNDEAVIMSDQQKREAFIQLSDVNNTVKGFGSCNQFQGTFIVNDNNLSFASIAATRKACLNGMDMESKLLQVLELTSYYSINHHDLTLFDSEKQIIVRFQAQYFN